MGGRGIGGGFWRLWEATICGFGDSATVRATIGRLLPPMASRFLPTQEWSGGGMGDCWRIWRGLGATIWRADSTRRCRPVKNRFLPTQEWSAWGREICWRIHGSGDSATVMRQFAGA